LDSQVRRGLKDHQDQWDLLVQQVILEIQDSLEPLGRLVQLALVDQAEFPELLEYQEQPGCKVTLV
jgi:hypothetical protein